MKTRTFVRTAAIMVFGLAACEAEPTPPLHEQLAGLNRDLAIGSTGGDVRAVHQYLRRYGYFPNDQLARSHPAWRPIVATAPEREDVFDERTADAIRHFQINQGILTTGAVDESTRRLLKMARCGVPDGIEAGDPADKFSHVGSKWPSRTISWRLADATNAVGVTPTEARNAIIAAFAGWSAQTGLSFVERTNADIVITFAQTTMDGLAEAAAPPVGDMTIDTDFTWSAGAVTPITTFDLQSVVLHELGHSLGLSHAPSPAVMQPTINPGQRRRNLTIDDNVGISSRYDVFTNLPGGARDIGAGANLSVWIIGTSATSGGFNIAQFNGTGWTPDVNGGGATRIAVASNGVPWIINNLGQIFRRTTGSATTGFWEIMPGLATDIGAGMDGSVWITGTTPISGGFRIFRFNGSQWDQDNQNGGAIRIAVGPRLPGQPVVPWIVNSVGQVFRRTTNSAFTGSWEMIMPSPGGTVRDIGIGTTHNAWVIRDTGGFGARVSVWNEQPAVDPEPAQKQWHDVFSVFPPGANCAISIGPNARPWFVTNNGTISTSTP